MTRTPSGMAAFVIPGLDHSDAGIENIRNFAPLSWPDLMRPSKITDAALDGRVKPGHDQWDWRRHPGNQVPERRRLIRDHRIFQRLPFCGPGSRFAWPGRRPAALCLAAVVLFCWSASCQAALSPKQLGSAVLNPAPGSSLPLDDRFISSAGVPMSLGEATRGLPAALLLVDYTCRFICGTTLAIASAGLSGTGLQPGKDFSFVAVGIDPSDKPSDARAMKEAQLGPYPRLKASARFLNGEAAAIAKVTQALNYTPVYDAEIGQYAHPVGLVILTPEGRVSRVIEGLNLSPEVLRAALTDAGQGELSALVEGIRLLCYGHNPLSGAYASTIRMALILGGLLTLGGLAGGIALFIRRGGARS